MSVALLKRVTPDHCARNFNPGVALTVTPPAPAIVTWPAPVCKISMEVPTGYATVAFVGIVKVTPDAEDTSINESLSVSAESV